MFFKPGVLGKIKYLHSHHDTFLGYALPSLSFWVSREYFLHKGLGIVGLAHFFYRIAHIFRYGHVGFAAGDPWTLAGIVLHTLLALSALIFKPPVNRSAAQPMIYREYQLHSVIFSLRSLAVLFFTYLDEKQFRGVFILLAHYCADIATAKYKQGTTMRDMPYPNDMSEAFKTRMNLFYSYSQILAVVGCFLFGFDGAFLVLFPIQFAAFLLTMVRKSIIEATAWHVLYTWSLSLAYIYSLTCLPTAKLVELLTIGTTCAVLRFKFRLNKYLLWVPLCFYTVLQCDDSHRECLKNIGFESILEHKSISYFSENVTTVMNHIALPNSLLSSLKVFSSEL